MNRPIAIAFAATAALAAPFAAASAQSPPLNLMKDVDQVHAKLAALAKAMPADKYTWAPGAGVRSVGEVFLHVASDNYLLPAMVGLAAPASTGIDAKKYETVTAFEKRGLSHDATVAELETSFAPP